VDAGRLDEAAAALRAHLQRDPSDREARSFLARVLSWERRFGESIAEYERLLADRPERAADRAGYARVLAWSGRIERSLEEFRLALADDSTDVETWIAYARALSWVGDLPAAATEYRRILRAHPEQGDAWLGYATVARWRAGATASDRFLRRAEANGAERTATDEERAAVRRALAPGLGAGWSRSEERQYVAGPDFSLRSSGPFTTARVTIGRTADLGLRAAWMDMSERAESGVLNYDLDVRLAQADLTLVRGYPLQAAAGLEARRFSPGVATADFPLLGAGNFVGWHVRTWGFLGRFTPSLTARRSFLALKSLAPVREIHLGHQTVVAGGLGWQWGPRGSASGAIERGGYSDGNSRLTLRAGSSYRLRLQRPTVVLDYAVGYTDFDTTSTSYFTPLRSMRHSAGLALDGHAERRGLSYGVRYEFSTTGSDNFAGIRAHAWSAHMEAARLGPVGLGVDGSYSRDNNAYEVWSLGIHAGARW